MTAAAGTEGTAGRPADHAGGTPRPWTLQRRLIVTIVGIVSFILVLVAVATSAILGNVLESRLDQSLTATVSRTSAWVKKPLLVGESAAEALGAGWATPDLLLGLQNATSEASAAIVDEVGSIVELDRDQLAQLAAGVTNAGATTVSIDGVGDYRAQLFLVEGSAVVVGVSHAPVSRTLGQMLTTIALLTVGGLILLLTATVWVIRSGLGPLRAVSETAARVSRLPLDKGEVSISDRVPAELADPRTEVGQVGDALNTLLAHVDGSLVARARNEERMRRFVADASHELRTPLASIRGYSELSLRDPLLSDDTAQALERIQAQSLRMTSLVEDLLLLARLDEGRELVHDAVDLSMLTIEAVGDARAAGTDHVWRMEMDEDPVRIVGDAPRLTQVLTNLLANARTHTPPGTTVTVSVRAEGTEAVVRVHDDGPGIAPSVRGELFERFARADGSRDRRTGGTGLGLSIARAIVQAHGGRIQVDSVPGDTTFSVFLPAAGRL